MSRIGKLPIEIPQGVSVERKDNLIKVKGPKGELSIEYPSFAAVDIAENKIIVSVKNPREKKERAEWGLLRQLIANGVIGVTQGFEKKLQVNGIGYKVKLEGKDKLILEVGFSHPVEFKAPPGIEFQVKENIITVLGIDKQLVGETAAQIRRIKPPEPYKGKGIKYVDEVIQRKAGKVVKATAE